MSRVGYPMSIKRLGDALEPLVFPPPPLKFRTAGFPQYGFKRDTRATTFAEPKARLILGASPGPCPLWPRRACRAGAVLLSALVQRPLARQRVMLSRRVLAYYGLMCPSRLLSPAYFLRHEESLPGPPTAEPATERFPNLLCVSVPSCRLPYPGGPHGCSRLILHRAPWPSPSLHWLGIHSATIADSQVVCVTRLQSSLHGTARGMASPSSARSFTFELSPPESPLGGVEYNYAGNQPIPAAGLSPARHAALWAASKVRKEYKEVLLALFAALRLGETSVNPPCRPV